MFVCATGVPESSSLSTRGKSPFLSSPYHPPTHLPTTKNYYTALFLLLILLSLTVFLHHSQTSSSFVLFFSSVSSFSVYCCVVVVVFDLSLFRMPFVRVRAVYSLFCARVCACVCSLQLPPLITVPLQTDAAPG